MFQVILFLAFSLKSVTSMQPRVIEAVKLEKDIVFQGIKNNYLVYEVTFDQDIYFVENWPCPCIELCPSKEDNSIEVEAQQLDKGEWMEAVVSGNPILFKFYFSTELECSAVQIILSNHWGEATGYVGVGRVPTVDDYDFVKHPRTRDSFSVCPSEDKWNRGWWYILVAGSDIFQDNYFQLSWNTSGIPMCVQNITEEDGVLSNNVGYYGTVEANTFQYFKFPITGCPNFSVSAKQTSIVDGNLDLYISFSIEQPTIHTYDYSSHGDGDDTIALVNVCSPTGYVYIGLRTCIGNNVPFVLTATTDYSFNLRRVDELPPQQFLYTFSYGQASLECEQQTELKCEFYSHEGCLDYFDADNCCSRFGFLPPLEDPKVWGVSPSIDSSKGYEQLPWSLESLSSIEDNVPRKLVFRQYLSSESATMGRVYSKDKNCSLKLNKMLVNSEGEQLPERVYFEPYSTKCKVNKKAYDILDSMKNITDLELLKLREIQFSEASNTKGMIGCHDLILSYTINAELTSVWSDTSCYDDGQNLEEDPCCNYSLSLTECCSAHNVSITKKKAIGVIQDFPLNNCSKNKIYYFAYAVKSTEQCIQDWTISIGNIDTVIDFVYSCLDEVYNRHCTSNEDCLYEAACDTTFGRCLNTLDDLKECWWSSMDSLVHKSLFNFWKLDGILDRVSFFEKLVSYTIEEYPTEVLEGCYDCTQSTLRGCISHNFAREECTVHESCVSILDNENCLREGCFEDFVARKNGLSCNSWGCFSNTTKELCKGRWISLDDPSREACFDGTIYNYQNEASCNCSGLEWKSLLSLTNTSRELVWNPSITSFEPPIDIPKFHGDLEEAVSIIASLSYYKSAQCRNRKVQVYKAISCDLEKEGRCFEQIGLDAEKEWVCPFIETNITQGEFHITFGEDVVPLSEYCQVVDVNLFPITVYQTTVQSRLSSQSFTESPPGSYASLKEQGILVSGQVLTNGVEVVWNFVAQSNISICISFAGVPEYELFDIYTAGRIQEDDIVIHSEAYINDGKICFYIDEPGLYIGLKTRNVNYTSLLSQSIVAVIIYIAELFAVLYQIVNLVLGEIKRKYFKVGTAFLIVLFLIIRIIYFIIYPIGNISASIAYIFFEFPNLLFMIMNSVVIFLWIEITYTTKRMAPSPELSRKLFLGWALWCLFLLTSFVILIISYYVTNDDQDSDCVIASIPINEISLVINKVYVVFVVSVCFVLTLAMIVFGWKFMNQLSKGVDRLLVRTWILMSVFSATFTVKSSLMIASAFSNFVTPILVFTSLEQCAVVVLLYYLRPPLSKQLKDLSYKSDVMKKIRSSSKNSEKSSKEKSKNNGASTK